MNRQALERLLTTGMGDGREAHAMMEKAKTESETHKCDQYVNFNTNSGHFYVSDFYNSDSTIARFFNGIMQE